ncbi:hypothetical protein N7474_009725 [Penicillium riverlandense]|uniref:uncharacterized protein n=1 Tax=Penicillium riverlandense TaxID=1903569 RepID=UPI0025468A09|nr:uncharacterized protein N7474_009725 [Penicillium riverlandense]KAJ5808456.1 hypothetical protein N7474_009725 [Penicillium riverlandense]
MRNVQSFFSRLLLRYHETPEGQPDETELVTITKPESLRSETPQIFENVTLAVEERLSDEETEINAVKPQKPRWIVGVSLCAKASALVLLVNVLFSPSLPDWPGNTQKTADFQAQQSFMREAAR